MTRILIHSEAADAVAQIVIRRHPGATLETCTTYGALSESVASFAPEIVFTNRFDPGPFPAKALTLAPSVLWIANAGSGVNHLMPWDPAKITVTNSAGVAADAMAEFALAAMLHFATDRRGLAQDQAQRIWRARATQPLSGQTLLCVGLGKTGRRMAALGKALGMRVLGVRASGAETPDVDVVFMPAQIGEALAQADQILICLPLTPASRNLISAEAISQTKQGAVLVDLSRGGILNLPALLESLDKGRLKGAALDVFPIEPLPLGDPLWAREDILISPHCSGVYAGWEHKSAEMFADNLGRWLAGKPLHNVIDPAKGY